MRLYVVIRQVMFLVNERCHAVRIETRAGQWKSSRDVPSVGPCATPAIELAPVRLGEPRHDDIRSYPPDDNEKEQRQRRDSHDSATTTVLPPKCENASDRHRQH